MCSVDRARNAETENSAVLAEGDEERGLPEALGFWDLFLVDLVGEWEAR